VYALSICLIGAACGNDSDGETVTAAAADGESVTSDDSPSTEGVTSAEVTTPTAAPDAKPTEAEDCASLAEEDVDRCLDETAGGTPPEPLDIPPDVEEKIAEREKAIESCTDLMSRSGGVVRSREVGVYGDTLADRQNGTSPAVALSCGTTEPTDFVLVETSAGLSLLPGSESLEVAIRNWLDGPTLGEQSAGLVTPLTDSSAVLTQVRIKGDHAEIEFDTSILNIGEAWEFPAWIDRFRRELGWQIALSPELSTFSILVGEACYERVVFSDPDVSSPCEVYGLEATPTREVMARES